MSKLLVCAATLMELRAFSPHFNSDGIWISNLYPGNSIAYGFTTGVGIPLTLAALPDVISQVNPDSILNIGIAGAYPNSGFEIGDIVMGSSEVFGDIGFELPDSPGFQPLSSTPMGKPYSISFELYPGGWRHPTVQLKYGAGCTVNCCTGTDATGRLREKLLGVQFETMEGAAVAMVGRMNSLPVTEIRAISNIAGRRDMRPENIKLALERLTLFFQEGSFGTDDYE